MPIYEKPVWQLMWDMVSDLDIQKEDIIYRENIIKWFSKKYPKIKRGTMNAHIIKMTTNAPSRVHYNANQKDDLFFQIDSKQFRLYNPRKDPTPVYSDSSPKTRTVSSGKLSLENQIVDLINAHQLESREQLEESRKIILELQTKNKKLQEELNRERSLQDEVIDKELKDRLTKLGTPPMDTLIRETVVVFEHRLRSVGNVEADLVGTKLVEAVLSKNNGALIFSTHPGEQDGIMMLYRGAMQFIRNPPMHGLIEYEEKTARLYIRLIDTLLQFLKELSPRHRDEVSVDAVRVMLTRRPLPPNIIKLFIHVYSSDEGWVSLSSLATVLGMNNSQIPGVLGALGTRVNTTHGLEGKGGIQAILDCEKLGKDEWHYRMRPVLRKALEIEKIV